MKWCSGIAFLCLVVGCQVPSRMVMMEGEGGRTAYNTAIQMTNSQQMLLNLVRIRYADFPMFLDVTSVTTQSTFQSRLSPTFPIPGFNEDNPFTLGADISWEDQPTITYTPLEGQSFATRLLRPIDLSTVQLLCYSGWDIDRVFRIMIQNFDELSNAPEASAPVLEQMPQYRQFAEAAHLLRHFQKRGELQIGVKAKEGKAGDEFVEERLQIAFPHGGPEGERLSKLIGCTRHASGKCIKEIDFGYDDKGSIGILPRSVLSCMCYLSQGVQVPKDHVACGMVHQPSCEIDEEEQDWHTLFHELLAVKESLFRPSNAFISVKYRQHWFYIDECDLASKRTFALLVQLYNLNAIAPKNRGPILTLPLK